MAVRISGVGCCLLDRIYGSIDFHSDAFRKYLSMKAGDGGLEPGKLTFEEELERFAGQHFASEILPLLTNGCKADKENIGGPCIVALINASQFAYKESEVSFYGCRGDDEVGADLLQKLTQTSLDLSHYRIEKNSETASTSVLSDPNYDNGHGERTFVNTIGASWHYLPDEVDESFYDSEICVFGGTALVPRIHQELSSMLKRAKAKGCITIVNTVYDFINEKKNPDKRWPLGESDESYQFIDLLLVDHEEALRLSGCQDIPSAIAFFREKGTGAVVVTNGAHNISLWADSPLFGKVMEQTMPVSEAVGNAIKAGKKGDSTGCGDNFAGGIIGSLAMQISLTPILSKREGGTTNNVRCSFDLREACRWGIVSGGFACFYYGGTYLEEKEGEKLAQLQALYDQYLKQEHVC
ncbi:MAG: carbohydrate kinase family protein [Bacteroidaceae bacterium]|nr:carbohydrate kinase family protein [Bacteroidaceae bacterium]